MLKTFKLPDHFNYIGVFLTLRCNFGCEYCINRHGDYKSVPELTPKQWIEGLSRLETRPDLPLTLQGGEPTLYEGWKGVADALWRADKPLDLLTNGSFDFFKFVHYIDPRIFNREAKYSSIRFSFHPSQHDAHALATKALLLRDRGYSVGIWGLNHPACKNQNRLMKKICDTYNVDFRMKDFLGMYKGEWHGIMKYEGACSQDCNDPQFEGKVLCRTTELLINPSGDIFRCHADLYVNRHSIANILDEDLVGIGAWTECENYGMCNPCDIKVKTNRLQEYGHTSVEIREVKVNDKDRG